MGQITKSDKNRMWMSQIKDKNSPHTKGCWNEVGKEDLGFVQLANRLIPREGKRRPYKSMPIMS